MQTLNILGVYFTYLHFTYSKFSKNKIILFINIFHSISNLGNARFATWWAQMDLNHRPRAYQARALTN